MKWIKKGKRLSEMTDDELKQEYRTQHTVMKIYAILSLLIFATLLIRGLIDFSAIQSDLFLVPLLFIILLVQVIIIDRVYNEQRFRELKNHE